MDSQNTSFNFDLLHINIRGIRANKFNLENYLDIHKPEIVTINESKLGNETPFQLENYICATRKEPNTRGGKRGSMILVSHKCKDAVELDLPTRFKEEIIGIKLSKKGPRPSINTHLLQPSGNGSKPGHLSLHSISNRAHNTPRGSERKKQSLGIDKN